MLRPEVVVARRLRRTLSLPEAMLWARLRRCAGGVRFRRQHPIGPYVVDFCCLAGRLVVEIDGEAHDRGDRPRRDVIRDGFVAEQEYRIGRVAAALVLAEPDRTADAIVALVASPLHQPAAGPPPRAGED